MFPFPPSYFDEKQTERLKIRPIETSDAAAWCDYFRNNDGLKFVGIADTSDVNECAKQWVERQLWRYQTKQYGLLALCDKKSNDLVGQCGLLLQQVNGKFELEIGYHVLPKFWGNGFATEAAHFFRDYAFNLKLRDSLISIIHVHNVRSQRVAEKNNMTREAQTEFKGFPVFVYRTNGVVK